MVDRELYWKDKRVELHPGMDRWMMGDRYGKVVNTTKRGLKIRLDRSGVTVTVPEDHVREVT